MTRNVCCLALTCLLAACAPQKATVVEDTTLTKPQQNKPQPRDSGTSDASPQLVVQESGMKLPPLTDRLPERKDMVPTAVPPTGGGPTAIATPPKQ